MDYKQICPADNVKVSLADGHKTAVRDIQKGEAVIKYGFPIGLASCDIKNGETVHTHNLKTALSGVDTYVYTPEFCYPDAEEPVFIQAYVRKNGKIGIRNDVWIINTVGCINKTAERLAARTGAFCFPHPYGCSQLGTDHVRTRTVLCNLVKHPNAGGVLVLGLGCENNRISEFKAALGEYDPERIRFLNVQDCEDEIEEGERIINELQSLCLQDKRKNVPVSKLVVGMKCGGSDGLSGITANPLCGQITDRLVAMGAACLLTEVPEMFGAEQLLLNRCVSRDVFNEAADLINDYKRYFIAHGQPVFENPSPGNKDGGITTLEEKSLGCVQKGGTAPVVGVLRTGDVVQNGGLYLLDGPGNDMIAVTNLTAAGCHIILFTTGRGTPLGAPVPTVKIATGTALCNKKPHWIDFDAQCGTKDELSDLLIRVANGEQTKNEQNAYREIAVFKDGVTL